VTLWLAALAAAAEVGAVTAQVPIAYTRPAALAFTHTFAPVSLAFPQLQSGSALATQRSPTFCSTLKYAQRWPAAACGF
jgi:hypothetical protein